VKTSHHRCQNYFLKGNFPCKKGCHKEHKSKLDHLRGLNAHKGKLRTIAGLGQHKNGCQKDNAHACIDPGKVLQKFHLPDHNRNHQCYRTSAGNDQKLLIGRSDVQPAQHNKAYAEQHAHIIQKKHGCILINPAV